MKYEHWYKVRGINPGKPGKGKGMSEFIRNTVWGKNIPSKEKLNRTFLFVVKLLFFIIRDAAFGHNRPDVEGGFN